MSPRLSRTWHSLRLGTRSWHVWACGNPWVSSLGMNSGATPTRVYGLQAPEIQMQGEETGGVKVGQHWDQVSWPAVGNPWLPGLGGPPWSELGLHRESLRSNFSSAIATPFLLLLQGHCCKSFNFPQHLWSPLHSPDPSLPLLAEQPALCLPTGRHGGTEIIGTPTLLQGAQGLLGDTDEVTDHDIPVREEGH